MNILEFNDVTKKIFNFDIKPTNIYLKEREILGVLGLKGSGKSTLYNLILNFYRPKSGTINIFGLDSVKDSKAIKMDLGVIPESNWFDENIKPIKYIKNAQKSRGVNDKEEINYLIDYFDLNLSRKITEMNQLELKKLSIIAALSSNPKLIIVDEPDSIPDSVTRMKLFNILDERNRQGSSVLIFSSNLREAQSICQNIYFIDKGEIIKQEDQKNKLSNDKILKFYDSDVDLSIIEKTGAKLVKTGDETVYYFSGPLNNLSEAIYRTSLIDYTLEDSNLEEKITILKKDRLFGRDTESTSDVMGSFSDEPNLSEKIITNENREDNTVIINYDEDELFELTNIPDNANNEEILKEENNKGYSEIIIENPRKIEDSTEKITQISDTIIIKSPENSNNVVIKDMTEPLEIENINNTDNIESIDNNETNIEESFKSYDTEWEEL